LGKKELKKEKHERCIWRAPLTGAVFVEGFTFQAQKAADAAWGTD